MQLLLSREMRTVLSPQRILLYLFARVKTDNGKAACADIDNIGIMPAELCIDIDSVLAKYSACLPGPVDKFVLRGEVELWRQKWVRTRTVNQTKQCPIQQSPAS